MSQGAAVQANSGQHRRRSWFARMVWRVLTLAIALALLLQLYFFAHVLWYRWFDPVSSAFMRSEAIRLVQQEPSRGISQTWVPYSEISRYAKRAVIAAEDTGFVDHHGIEWEAIERAARVNLEAGEIAQGGSTITMQLAKNLFLSSDRSYIRKAQEIVIAGMLELVMDKARILELYLNLVEWGDGVFGIEAAARHYYGASAARLNPRQAAWLAAILPAPKRYDRDRQSSWIERKTGIILRRMPQVQIPS